MTGLEIEKKKKGSELKLILAGRIDANTAMSLGEVISKEALKDITSLIFEMEKVKYISSAGLRELIIAQQIMDEKGKMVIRNLNPAIKEIFDNVGFSSYMTFEND